MFPKCKQTIVVAN